MPETKICEDVYELEDALGEVAGHCKLVSPVQVSYDTKDGERVVRVLDQGLLKALQGVVEALDNLGALGHHLIARGIAAKTLSEAGVTVDA